MNQTLLVALNLDDLLPLLQQQIGDSLGLDSFYMALNDERTNRLWYPLVVIKGARRYWSPQPMADCMAARVISEQLPAIASSDTGRDPLQCGFPAGEGVPATWMGVPLSSAEQGIGCLAVFTFAPRIVFTQKDLEIFLAMSRPVSVAVANVLLFERAQRRANQLEILSRYSMCIASSLHPDEILDSLCQMSARVEGVKGSAVFTLDLEQGKINLAHSCGLSDNYSQRNRSFLLIGDRRSRCLLDNQSLQIPDISQANLDAEYFSSLESEGIRALADFPLVSPDGQIGYLSVYYDSYRKLTEDDLGLFSTIAVQAALAVSNARLHQRTDTALSRRMHQLTILETISRELASAFQSEHLFDMILDFALEFTNSAWGSISLYDSDTHEVSVEAWRGYQEIDHFPDTVGISGRAIRLKQVVNVSDVSQDPDYRDYSQGKARSHLSVPLMHESRLLGVLSLESAQPAAFSDNDETFINQLATQASIALVNSELYKDSKSRLRELSTLYLVSTRLVGNLNLERVLDTLARAMLEVVNARVVGVYLWNSSLSNYQLHLQIKTEDPSMDYLPESIPALQLKEYSLSLSDTAPLIFFVHEGRLKFIFEGCREGKILIFPMVVSQLRLGMAVLYTREQPPIREDGLQLLRAIAAQGAIALQNASLFADVSRVRDRLAAVLNSVREGILLLEAGGQIILANEALRGISGVPLEELLNKRLEELPAEALKSLGYTLEDAGQLVAALDRVSGSVLSKGMITLGDGSPAQVLERSTLPVLDESGITIGWMVVLRDVTEEQQVAQARELISETLIHDLRSPISAVLGALEVMEDSLPPVENGESNITNQALQVARRGAFRVLSLIETLLDIARLQSGKMDISPGPVDLHRLVVTVLNEYIPQSNEFGVELCNEIPSDLPYVYVDQGKLSRVIANLVDNALKFAPSGSQVVVTARPISNDQVLVQVSDNGPGIPEDYRDKIFERFSQIPGSRGRRRGTGLGLTFCRLAIEAHGGRIWVEANPDGGSIFKFTFPHERKAR